MIKKSKKIPLHVQLLVAVCLIGIIVWYFEFEILHPVTIHPDKLTNVQQEPNEINGMHSVKEIPLEESKEFTLTVKELVTGIPMNDYRILEYIRKNHLTPPSKLPYNLQNPNIDPGDVVGIASHVRRVLGNLKNGFFLEAGSNDGETLSSTLGFERFDGWTGLMVEPSPVELVNLRSKNRKAWIADVCASTTKMPSTLDFLHRVDFSIASQIGTIEDVKGDRKKWLEFKVPCFPIFSLLSALEVTIVDFFNLDAEGVELAVLKTIPFDQILFKVISIECHLPEPQCQPFKTFMSFKGYQLFLDRFPDYIFVHPSLNQKPVQV